MLPGISACEQLCPSFCPLVVPFVRLDRVKFHEKLKSPKRGTKKCCLISPSVHLLFRFPVRTKVKTRPSRPRGGRQSQNCTLSFFYAHLCFYHCYCFFIYTRGIFSKHFSSDLSFLSMQIEYFTEFRVVYFCHRFSIVNSEQCHSKIS